MAGLETLLQAFVYICQENDHIGKRKEVNVFGRRAILDFLCAKQYVAAALERKGQKDLMDEHHMSHMVNAHHDDEYAGTSYASEDYFRRDSSMDQQWADERSRGMIESLVAPRPSEAEGPGGMSATLAEMNGLHAQYEAHTT
jgi:hypothetical protein